MRQLSIPRIAFPLLAVALLLAPAALASAQQSRLDVSGGTAPAQPYSLAADATGKASADEVTPEAIRVWIAQLDAQAFEDRRVATRELIQHGQAAAQPLATALQGGSREFVMRGVHVLQQIAVSDDALEREAGHAALRHVVSSTQSHVARQQAQTTLASLNHALQLKTLASLEALGATISFQDYGGPRNDVPVVLFANNNTVILGENWRGTPADLRQLELLVDLDEVRFDGERFNDEYMAPLRLSSTLSILVLSHTSISAQGIEQLAEIPSLRMLQIRYTPLTDQALTGLAKLKQVHEIMLFGTQISAEGAKSLNTALAGASIRYHRGAFLGVGPGNMPQDETGLMVGMIAPDSAAEQAGIEVGDVITRIGDVPVKSFDDLRAVMEKTRHGEAMKIAVLRRGKELVREVQLGEREDDVAGAWLPALPAGQPVPPPRLPRAPQPVPPPKP